MSESPWLMRVENGLSAHFKQENGLSRPGTLWSIAIRRGGEIHHTTVKTLLADGVSRKTSNDQAYQSRTAMQYLNDQINQGWNPAVPRDHVIYIGDPIGAGSSGAQAKPWWKFW